jgi:hypothetical protein
MEYSRQHVIDLLHTLRRPELVDEASRDLPDPVDVDQLVAWACSTALPTMRWLARWAAAPESGGSPRPFRPSIW